MCRLWAARSNQLSTRNECFAPVLSQLIGQHWLYDVKDYDAEATHKDYLIG